MANMAPGWTPYNSSGNPWASNQYASFPNMNPGQTPGVVPQQMNFSSTPFRATDPWGYGTGGANALSGGMETQPTMSPQFTQQWYQYLTSQLGQGVSPFNLSAIMPSSGAATVPGTLTAPMTGTLADLQQFLAGGPSSIPGLNQLGEMAQTGDPINATPAWQAMVEAMQRQTDEGAANLREQFSFAGNLDSSPFGSAIGDYFNQDTLNKNALLGQMTQQSLESAMGRKLTAGQDMSQMGMQLGDLFQNLDQNSITALYNEFMRTSPQNNPLLSFMGQGALSSPSMYQPAQSSIMGDIGSLLGPMLGIGGIGGTLGSLGKFFGFGQGNSGGGGGNVVPASIPGLGPTNEGTSGWF